MFNLIDADGIIVIGSVEPHYFAGFTDGRKFLLPGLAGLEAITNNHMLALDSNSRILNLDGNPVHEDLMETLSMFNRYNDIFSIQLVVNADRQIFSAQSGHIVRSFNETVTSSRRIYVAPILD